MMKLDVELPPITMLADEYEKLRTLAEVAEDSHPQVADYLAREVERAVVVGKDTQPQNFVTMGSEVEFRDEVSGQVRRMTLVYPPDADVSQGKISVLTPIGAALIGLSVGQTIAWQTVSNERRRLTVLAVKQPAHA
jgi:regulator of nucleoside diphosphate kinase